MKSLFNFSSLVLTILFSSALAFAGQGKGSGAGPCAGGEYKQSLCQPELEHKKC